MKRIIISLAVTVCLVFTGCRTAVDIKNLQIAEMITIDFSEDMYTVTLTLKEKTDPEPVYITVSGEGYTIAHSLDNAVKQAGSEIYLGDLRAVVLSESTVTSGKTVEVLNYLNAHSDITKTTPVTVYKGNLDDLNGDSPIAGSKVETVLSEGVKQHMHPTATIMSLLREANNQKQSMTLPILQNTSEDGVELLCDGLAILDNGSYVTSLTADESEVAMWLLSGEGTAFTDEEHPTLGSTAVKLKRDSVSIMPMRRDDFVEFEIKLTLSGEAEYVENSENISSTITDTLAVFLEDSIKTELENVLLKTVKDHDTDIFTLCSHLKKYTPEYWLQNGGSGNPDNIDTQKLTEALGNAVFTVEVEISSVSEEYVS